MLENDNDVFRAICQKANLSTDEINNATEGQIINECLVLLQTKYSQNQLRKAVNVQMQSMLSP